MSINEQLKLLNDFSNNLEDRPLEPTEESSGIAAFLQRRSSLRQSSGK